MSFFALEIKNDWRDASVLSKQRFGERLGHESPVI